MSINTQPYSAFHQVGQTFSNSLNINFNHTIVVLVRTNIPKETLDKKSSGVFKLWRIPSYKSMQ
jgi:hypothetical protein